MGRGTRFEPVKFAAGSHGELDSAVDEAAAVAPPTPAPWIPPIAIGPALAKVGLEAHRRPEPRTATIPDRVTPSSG